MHQPRAAALASPALTIGGGALLVLSAFLPWTSTGLGSTRAGRDLADLFLAGTLTAWVPRWTGFGLYLLPASGALLLVATGLGGRRGRRLARGAVVTAATVAVGISAGLSWGPLARPGAGAVLVGAGLVLAAGGLLADHLRRAR